MCSGLDCDPFGPILLLGSRFLRCLQYGEPWPDRPSMKARRRQGRGSRGALTFHGIIFCCTCRLAVAIRDRHVDVDDDFDLADPSIFEDPAVDLAQLEDATVDASYVDCMRRWADERQRQLAFWQGYGHLLAAQQKVQRLHLSLRTSEPLRNVTLLVSDLQHRLGWLSDASSRYAARLKGYVDTLHPRLRTTYAKRS